MRSWISAPGHVTRIIVRGEADVPAMLPAVREFIDYMSTWATTGKMVKTQSGAAEYESRLQRCGQYRADLERYFQLCPRSLSTLPVHYCLGPGICCANIGETAQKLSDAGQAAFLRNKTRAGDTNKWTKQWQSFDFLMAGDKVHHYLPNCWDPAFAAIKFDHDCGTSAASVNAVTGRRCRQIRNSLHDACFMFALLVYLIATEVLRRLTTHLLLITARERAKNADDVAAHLDLLNPSFSLLTAIHQYQAFLLFDSAGSGRLLLLWDDEATYETWVHKNLLSQKVRLLRRTVMFVDGTAHVRHDEDMLSLPWSLCCFADKRANPELLQLKSQVASYYDTLRDCCPRAGATNQLVSAGITSERLQQGHYMQLWPLVAEALNWSICDVECANAFTARNSSCHGSSFGLVCSKHVANNVYANYAESLKHNVSLFPSLDAQRAATDDDSQTKFYSSKYHAFMSDYSTIRSHTGAAQLTSSSGVTDRYWDDLKLMFDALPPERQAMYERLSAHSKARSKAAKQAIERARSAADQAGAVDLVGSCDQRVLLNGVRSAVQCTNLPSSVHASSLTSTIALQQRESAAGLRSFDGSDAPPDSDLPILVSELERTMALASRRKNDTHKRWNDLAQQTVVPPSEAAVQFPSNIHYRRGCGPICRTINTAQRVLLQDALVASLNSLLKCYEKPMELSRDDPLVVVKLVYEDLLGIGGLQTNTEQFHFAFPSSARAASGIHPPILVFFSLDVIAGDPLESLIGLTLELRRRPLVQLRTTFPSPLTPDRCQQSGALEKRRTEAFAAFLIDGVVRGELGDFWPAPERACGNLTRITMRMLRFEDVSPSQVKSTSQSSLWEPQEIIVSELGLRSHAAHREAPTTSTSSSSGLGLAAFECAPNTFGKYGKDNAAPPPSVQPTGGNDRGEDLGGLGALLNTPGTTGDTIENMTLDLCGLGDLAAYASDELVQEFRSIHQNMASEDAVDLTLSDSGDSDSNSEFGRKTESASSRAAAKKPGKASKAKTKQPEITSTKLAELMTAATPDTLCVREVPGTRYPTFRVSTDNSSSSSSAAAQADLADYEVFEISQSRTNIKAVCRIHKDCACWVTIPGNKGSEVETSLREWFKHARVLPAAYHQHQSILIRESFSMVPRQQRGAKKR